MSSFPVIIAALSPLFPALLTLSIGALIAFLMRPRRFYFVRHGETVLNAAHTKQGPDGGLSELGKKQAEATGALLAPLAVRAIISSPYERAKETATIINKKLRVPVSYTSLLAERRNPSEVIGKDRDDPEVKRIIDQIDLAYHDDDYRHSDEENFIDLKKRARRCLRYLAWHGSLRNCVVTHHAFLKMLLSYMLYHHKLHSKDYVKLSYFNMSDNGGISVCEYHPWKMFSATRGWEIVSFNETPE
ncbi:MAG: histidine phosphatase family protein [Patescibacteria group bacterium]|nr:histidine phosphatase family protein [Patescibacteria group bacterium]